MFRALQVYTSCAQRRSAHTRNKRQHPCLAGLLIGFISTESIISVIGLVLGRGTIISLLLVLFVLPQMLVWGDRFISRTTVKGRRLRLHPLFDEDFEQIALRDRARKGK